MGFYFSPLLEITMKAKYVRYCVRWYTDWYAGTTDTTYLTDKNKALELASKLQGFVFDLLKPVPNRYCQYKIIADYRVRS